MNLIDQLKRDEGIRFKPYKDSVGKLTIGIGRNLDDVGINELEAEWLLSHDIDRAQSTLYEHLPWAKDLDEARRAVLLNMTFNMGIFGLMQFKRTLQSIQDGRYEDAADQMLESKWAEQVGPRAHRLAMQMKSGEWQ